MTVPQTGNLGSNSNSTQNIANSNPTTTLKGEIITIADDDEDNDQQMKDAGNNKQLNQNILHLTQNVNKLLDVIQQSNPLANPQLPVFVQNLLQAQSTNSSSDLQSIILQNLLQSNQ